MQLGIMQVAAAVGLGLLGLWCAYRVWQADLRLQQLRFRDYEPPVWLHLYAQCSATKVFYIVMAAAIIMGLLYAGYAYH